MKRLSKCSLYLCYQMSAWQCYQKRVTLKEENCTEQFNRPKMSSADFHVCKSWFQMICDSLSEVKTTITYKNGYERSHCFLNDRPNMPISLFMCVCCICVSACDLCISLVTEEGAAKTSRKRLIIEILYSINFMTFHHNTKILTGIHIQGLKNAEIIYKYTVLE